MLEVAPRVPTLAIGYLIKLTFLLEELPLKLVLHLLDFVFVEVDSGHQVLVTISIARDNVDVTLRNSPVCHCLALNVVNFVQKDAGEEVLKA